jgi:hypothetical protein
MSAAHTPGPWRFTQNSRGHSETRRNFVIRPHDGNAFLAEVNLFAGQPTLGEGNAAAGLANARLIAAAPELLAKLRSASELITLHADPLNPPVEMCSFVELLAGLDAAIANAEGRA